MHKPDTGNAGDGSIRALKAALSKAKFTTFTFDAMAKTFQNPNPYSFIALALGSGSTLIRIWFHF
jgi:hypothetical protein